MRVESSGKPDAVKAARPVWGWGQGEIPWPTPPVEVVFNDLQLTLISTLGIDLLADEQAGPQLQQLVEHAQEIGPAATGRVRRP